MPFFGKNYPDIQKREYGEKPFEDRIPPISPAAGCFRRGLLLLGLLVIIGAGAGSWLAVQSGQQATAQQLQLTNEYLLQVAESIQNTVTATQTATSTATPLSHGQMTLTAVASVSPTLTPTATTTPTATASATITSTPTVTATATASPRPPRPVNRASQRQAAPPRVQRETIIVTSPPQIIYVTSPPQIVEITVTPSPTKEDPPLPDSIPNFPDTTPTWLPTATANS